ncbi:hypothetical protein UlMin_034302 [Ulmus minor]
MKTHVAVVACPGMGHITPLFVFAKRLVVQYGFHVTFLNITTDASAAQNQLLHSPDLPPDFDVFDIPPVNISALVTQQTPPVTRISINVRESFRGLKSILVKIGKPKALVVDLFCTDAFEICQQLSIQAYLFYTASAALFAFSLYLPTLDREVNGEFVDLPEPVQVPGCTPLRTEDLLDQVRNRKIDEYKWFLFHSSRLTMAAGIFLNTWEDLEPIVIKAVRENSFYQQVKTPPVYPVGALTKETEPETDSRTEILAWLDRQPAESVVFIALGSGGTLTTEQTTEFALGLELSRQRFVWVVREPSDASSSASFFIAGGDVSDPTSYLPEGFLERTKEVGLVVPSWAPQVAVLNHPSTGAFWSHCGWNSTLESVKSGVPVIAWPLYAEQRMNATILMEEVGVGIKTSIEPGKGVIKRKEIGRLAKVVIEGEEGKVMRGKAKKLKESAIKALDSVRGSSYDSLSLAVEKWRA